MAGQYSHRQFFRKIPNSQLADYFLIKSIDLGVNLQKLKETDVEPIFQALSALPENKQAAIEADFQNINALACDSGIAALLNEADFYGDTDFPESIAAIDGYHAKAMWTLIHKPKFWKGASALLHADTVSRRSWKKRNDLPTVPPHVEDGDIKDLERAISHYFSKTEYRGRNCKVEPYRKVETGKEYFFAYPEDYGQSSVEWESDTLATRSHHPAFEIIFVYCQSEGSLDIYAPKNTKAIPELQKIFAKSILKLNTLPDGTIDKRVYKLDPLSDPNFDFKIPEHSNIKDVIVNKIRLTLKYGSLRRITLEADTTNNKKAVYELLDELKIPPHYITLVGIKVIFDNGEGKRPSTKTFSISHPNSCNLNHEGRDNIIRQMLVNSKIEPQLEKDTSAP
jgi:hypothetical protein